VLSQSQNRNQARIGNQIRIIEGDIDRSSGMRRLHLAGEAAEARTIVPAPKSTAWAMS
jgi:hypothetical protein